MKGWWRPHRLGGGSSKPGPAVQRPGAGKPAEAGPCSVSRSSCGTSRRRDPPRGWSRTVIRAPAIAAARVLRGPEDLVREHLPALAVWQVAGKEDVGLDSSLAPRRSRPALPSSERHPGSTCRPPTWPHAVLRGRYRERRRTRWNPPPRPLRHARLLPPVRRPLSLAPRRPPHPHRRPARAVTSPARARDHRATHTRVTRRDRPSPGAVPRGSDGGAQPQRRRGLGLAQTPSDARISSRRASRASAAFSSRK
jgi:hypothetical protein